MITKMYSEVKTMKNTKMYIGAGADKDTLICNNADAY